MRDMTRVRRAAERIIIFQRGDACARIRDAQAA